MNVKSISLLLAKTAGVFVVTVFAWTLLGVGDVYHRLVAAFMDVAYPPLDPAGIVKHVVLGDGEMLFRIAVGARRMTLSVNAMDVTSNTALLVALYVGFASRAHWRRLLVFFGASLLILFLVHAFTLGMVSQEAFMGHPFIARKAAFSRAWMRAVPRYTVFHEEMGMYLVVLILWLPWGLFRWRHPGRDDD